jgi:hypothetical protein
MSPYGPLLAFGALLGAAWLVTRTKVWGNRVDQRESERLKDPVYALLRREVKVRGQELEALPYERLLECDESVAYSSKRVDGIAIYFNAEPVTVEKNGDLRICIDANARVPEWKWRDVLPSYNFVKRKDGSVYYP